VRRLAIGALVLFPGAWRERYETEMRTLLAEQRIRPRTLLDLVRAAVDAHRHPNGLVRAPLGQMRDTAGAAVCAWIAFVVCGSAFAKLTEDRPFTAAAGAHPLLGGTRVAIEVLAVLSVVAVLLGGALLIAEVVREAWREREWSLVRAACAPLGAAAVFAVATGVLAWLANGHHLQEHTTGAWIAFLAWFAIGLGAATVCGLASRSALHLARPGPRALRAGVCGALVLTTELALMTAAVAVYCIALAVNTPSLANAANGPLGLISTTASLVTLIVLMTTITGLAAITSARGLEALRRPSVAPANRAG
jgi:hypothetical protein